MARKRAEASYKEGVEENVLLVSVANSAIWIVLSFHTTDMEEVASSL
jgi:hypothetical protein